MSIQSEHSRQMAMLKAAMPYVMPERRHAIEMLLQADALVHTARKIPTGSSDYSLEAAELHGDAAGIRQSAPFHPDPENMLLRIQEYCTPQESDLIQMVLNFIHAGKLFRGYQEFQKNHPVQKQADLSAASSSGNNQLMEFLLSRLNPEQKSTFEQFQKIMYNERCAAPERTSYDPKSTMAE